MMSRVQNGINGWYKDGAKNAEVLGFHRAMGTKRGSRVQQRFQPKTDRQQVKPA